MRFAYADPPYPGHTKRGLYKADPRCAEVDHAELVARLVTGFPDGWALSTGSNNLHAVLPLCPPDSRVMAWVKPFASFKPNVNPGYTWEPVIVRGGRRRERFEPTVRDFVQANILLKKGCAGAKPPEFLHWLFEVLNAQPGDELEDLFPGSGAVTEAWQRRMGQTEERSREEPDAREAQAADQQTLPARRAPQHLDAGGLSEARGAIYESGLCRHPESCS